MKQPTAASRDRLGTVSRRVVQFGGVMILLDLLFPVGLLIYARLIEADYWEMFYGEHGDAITWFSSLQLLLVATAAYLCFELERRRIWLVFSLAFVFLALDERFELHEALREGLIKPAGWFVKSHVVMPGDVVLYGYWIVGAAVAVLLVREIRAPRPSLVLFLAALALSAATIVVDSLDERITDEWGDGYFFTSVFEEVGELWSQLLFLLAFLVALHARLGRLRSREA